MRLRQPRIAPLTDDECDEAQRAALAPMAAGGGPVLNIFRTLVRAPEALVRFNEWGRYILSRRNSLPPRQREIVILRTGWLCRSGYEWAQHRRIGRGVGLSDAEIERVKLGADAGWEPADAALIAAVDDLVADHFVSDRVWSDLRRYFDEKACMDAVFTCGQYTQVSMFLNTFGVQLENEADADPDLTAP